MSTNDTNQGGPSAALLAAGVLLAAIVGAVLVTIYALSPQPRPSLDTELRTWAPYIVPLIPGLLAWAGISTVKRRQADVHKDVQQVRAQTNGALDARIESGVSKVLMRAGLATEDATKAHGIGPALTLPQQTTSTDAADATEGITPDLFVSA